MYLCGMNAKRIIMISLLVMSMLSLLAQPQGINYDANNIELNGDDWSEMIKQLNEGSEGGKFTIVHIGDSHVQPGIISGVVRRELQAKYGNGGRGLICPLSLAKTNAPSDYELKSSSAVSVSSKLLSRSKPAGMGMTGVAVKFAGSNTNLSIRTKQNGDEFNHITLFYSDNQPFDVSQGGPALKGTEISATASCFELDNLSNLVSLRLRGSGALYGIRLLNGDPGVVMDCIGNNGATFSSYLRINGFAEQLKDLNPQLVIISLGTNEAYGNYSSLEGNIDKLLKSISQECPGVKFLLTTPLETHKKTKGSFSIQTGVAGVRSIIMNYGKAHHIPVWDFYTIGGGQGAAARWLSVKYMNSDHLHLVSKGYSFVGELLSDALLKVFDSEK